MHQSRDEIAELPIGARNTQLLELRARVFGDALDAVAECPTCGERLEMNLRVSDFATPSPDNALPLTDSPTRELRVNGYSLTYRLANTNDLIAVEHAPDFNTARETLLQRLVTNVLGAAELAVPQVTSLAGDQLTAQLERDDPMAAMRVNLTCPNCQHTWETVLDIADFFWLELDAWAKRTLREVHTLASEYGWREGEILALSPMRRQLYLELIAS